MGITRGSEPAIFIVNGKIYEQAPLKTEVVDTMGAGDSFIGAFLVGYMDQLTVQEALYRGAVSAKNTCTFYGGFGYPKEL